MVADATAHTMIRYKKSVPSVGFVLLVLVLSSCAVPSDEQVKEAFLKEHPQAEITDVYVSEGDSDHAYFTIKYREGGQAHIGCWSYFRDANDVWQIRAKSSVPEGQVPKNYCQ